MSDTGKANDLLAQIPRGEKKGLPPVHLWNPPFCGDIDMRIARDGTWFYLGTPIGRKPMVKLFSSIIRRDGDDYFLVTPVEKVGIRVDDAPFVAVTLQVQGEGGRRYCASPPTSRTRSRRTPGIRCASRSTPHPGTHALPAGARQPRALVHRNVFYQLVELAVPRRIDGIEWLGVWSHGEFFPIGPQPD